MVRGLYWWKKRRNSGTLLDDGWTVGWPPCATSAPGPRVSSDILWCWPSNDEPTPIYIAYTATALSALLPTPLALETLLNRHFFFSHFFPSRFSPTSANLSIAKGITDVTFSRWRWFSTLIYTRDTWIILKFSRFFYFSKFVYQKFSSILKLTLNFFEFWNSPHDVDSDYLLTEFRAKFQEIGKIRTIVRSYDDW